MLGYETQTQGQCTAAGRTRMVIAQSNGRFSTLVEVGTRENKTAENQLPRRVHNQESYGPGPAGACIEDLIDG